ncbi:PREDICTED: uncharacterized protein LOC106820677 [Priapulus caudatus]|uniref:Uncharacterized protein LOC106820677 n=1 Tax=Priapulus caudatus TaxID=37621 RepID=A0ABM1F898_PRICU|nr:PREDICTED: uncharacterized protein LOC106820677 [Priapulus caudatus]
MADSTLENQTGQSHGGGSMVAEGGPIIDNSITSQCLSSDISVLSNPRNMSSEGQSFVNFDDTSSLFSITSSLSAPELQQRLVQVIQENKLLKDAVERNTSLMRQVAGWRDQIFKMSEDIEHNRQMHEQAKNTIISLNLEKEQCEKRMKALEKIVQESTEEEASGDSTHLIDHRLADLRDTVAELCAENSRLLQEKTQAEVENAKLNDCLWSLKDEQACGGAGAASMLNDYAVVRHLSNGKAELEDPSLPQNYIKDNDSQMLKAQVMSLVRELQNLEKKRLEPTDELKMAHSQIEELQRQLGGE